MGSGEWEKLCRYGGRKKRSFVVRAAGGFFFDGWGGVIYVCTLDTCVAKIM